MMPLLWVAPRLVLGDVVNLSQFGVNLTVLAPASSSVHRHESEDEFV